MNHKKNGMFAFMASLMPGAGEMYLGLYKQGVSLMAGFWAVVVLGSWMRLEFLFAALPVIWCYSFFHTHNLRTMTAEEFYLQEDRFLLCNEMDVQKLSTLVQNHKKLTAIGLIFLGVSMTIQMIYQIFSPFWGGMLQELFWNISVYGARGMVSVVIIVSGLYLLFAPKKESEKQTVEE